MDVQDLKIALLLYNNLHQRFGMVRGNLLEELKSLVAQLPTVLVAVLQPLPW